MTETIIAYSNESSSNAAGAALGKQISDKLKGESPHAVIVFASSQFSYVQLLEAIRAECRPKILVGCSSAGEFVSGRQGVSSASAIAIRSDEMRFTSSVATGLRTDRRMVARTLASPFKGRVDQDFPYQYILLLTDALAGNTDDLIEQLNSATGGNYEIFGGGAGDDAKFSETHVFHESVAVSDGAVALEILSSKPWGIGVQHGWEPTGERMRVTEANGMTLTSLDAVAAADVLEQHAKDTGQHFDRENPIPFFLHNALGIETPGGYKLRVPLAIKQDGSILCASDIPTGGVVSIMKASSNSSAAAAESAVRSALGALQGNAPKSALFFDCVATRLRMGKDFGLELGVLQKTLGASVTYAGCNSYGQVARVQGQFSGFHNCTAVVCIIPE